MMKHENIIRILSEEKANTYHSAILTSYSFDPFFFSSIIVPRLNRLGVKNIIVLVDAGRYDEMLKDIESLRYLERSSFSIVRKKSEFGGVFHPKITLLLGIDDGLLISGSGNLTINGYAHNHEIWGVYKRMKTKDSSDNLFRSVWNYIESLNTNKSEVISQQLVWAFDNTSWLIAAKDGPIQDDTDQVTFIANRIVNGKRESTASQIKEIIGTEKEVHSITVVSPFYDAKGDALENLYRTFSPNQMKCSLEDGGTVPYDCTNTSVEYSPIRSMSAYLREHPAFVHAKMVQFELEDDTFIYIGSANMTRNGWGSDIDFANDEAGFLISRNKKYNYMEHDLSLYNGDYTDLSSYASSNTSKEDALENPYELEILYAEISGDKLFLKVSTEKSAALDYCVELYDLNGKFVDSLPYETGRNAIQISQSYKLARYVVITRDQKEISNRCLLFDMYSIYRNSPSSLNPKLTGLFEMDVIDKNMMNLIKVVSDCFFCTTNNDIRTEIFIKKNNSKGKEEDITIYPDEYDNLLIKGAAGVNNINVELSDVFKDITSYWNAINEELSEDDNVKTDEPNDEDADHPDTTDEPRNPKTTEETIDDTKQNKWLKNCDATLRFIKKISCHYQETIDEKKDEDANVQSRRSADLQNLATMSIISCIVCFMISCKYNVALKVYDLKLEYIRLMSMFLCAVRFPCESSNSNITEKKKELHNTFFVNSLLIMLQTSRYKDAILSDKEVTLLNCLNLFESYKLYDNNQIEVSFNSYIDKSKEMFLENNYLYEQIKSAFDNWKAIGSQTETLNVGMIGVGYLTYTKRCGYMMMDVSLGGANYILKRVNYSCIYNIECNSAKICGELNNFTDVSSTIRNLEYNKNLPYFTVRPRKKARKLK